MEDSIDTHSNKYMYLRTCKSSHPHQAMYIWVCKDVAVQFIDQLFGVTAFEMIPEVMVCVSYSHMLLCMCCAYQV